MGESTHVQKLLLLLVLVGVLAYGLPPLAADDDSGLQSCITYCRLNFDPYLKPSDHAQCVERCKRNTGKRRNRIGIVRIGSNSDQPNMKHGIRSVFPVILNLTTEVTKEKPRSGIR